MYLPRPVNRSMALRIGKHWMFDKPGPYYYFRHEIPIASSDFSGRMLHQGDDMKQMIAGEEVCSITIDAW
jgi:hypothetical protein